MKNTGCLKWVLIPLLFVIAFSVAQADSLVLNGLSYHHGYTKPQNGENYGVGWLTDGGYELDVYRNSRKHWKHDNSKDVVSYSMALTYGRPVYRIGKLDLGYRVGGALYDDTGDYDWELKPQASLTFEYPLLKGIKLRVGQSWSVTTGQLLIDL